jgi:hypothetical protein
MLKTWRGMVGIVDGLEEKSTVATGIAKGARKRVLAQLPIIIFRESDSCPFYPPVF